MKKMFRTFLAMALICASLLCIGAAAMADGISVGIVNNPPSESGYREANVKDFGIGKFGFQWYKLQRKKEREWKKRAFDGL